ncbi:MAG: HAMP domain-containing protein [Planctomycetaceae bacterium]|nr:HAMP domain-containing protein [Planctomycetaceae bacterium]
MVTDIYRKCGPCFIPFILLATRLFAIVAGIACVLYVNYTLQLDDRVREAFVISALAAVVMAAAITFRLGLNGSRELRALLKEIKDDPTAVPQASAEAVRQALMFPFDHLRAESLLDPWITIFPICLSVRLHSLAPTTVIVQIVVAGFLGLSCILLLTFFLLERSLQPIVVDLQRRGVRIDFDQYPQTSLKQRLSVGFGVTILMTAVMIGGLALQRSQEIFHSPETAKVSATQLFRDTVLISLLAMTTGVVYSQVVAGSVTSRTSRLVKAMRKVEQGDYSISVTTSGTDEIDVLARQFNRMVRELAAKDGSLRELNENLEHDVAERTAQLRESLDQMEQLHKDLQRRNSTLEVTLAKLKQTQTQLVHSEKMTSLGQLVAGLAHEINNSVNAVHNGLPALLMKVATMRKVLDQVQDHITEPEMAKVERADKSIERLTMAIRDGVDRTTRIVRSMKQYSHPGTEEKVAFHAGEVIDRCLSLVHVSSNKSIRIEKDYRHTHVLHGPYSQFDQVFINLLSNAIDALGDSGQIVIDTFDEGSDLIIRFHDDGAGMPPELLNRIFDPFFTTKAPGKGTGLGLSVSYGIVDAAGGTMTCESEQGIGTTFTIRLPGPAVIRVPKGVASDQDQFELVRT